MINPVYLKLNNFLSHKETYYQFQEGQVVWVTGEVIPVIDADSNGSGKSALIEGLSIALLGEIIRPNITNSDLVMDNEDEANVELCLFDNVAIKEYIIKRKIPRTGSVKVWLYEDGKLNENLKSLKATVTDKHILNEILDLSQTDILNYFIISKNTYKPLFTSTDGTKKEIINRFSKGNLVDSADAAVKLDISEIDDELVELVQEKNLYEGRVLGYEDAVKSADTKKTFDEKKKVEIKELQDKILILKEDQKTTEDQIAEKELLLKDVQEEIDKISMSTLEEKKIKLDAKLRDLNDAKVESNNNLQEVKDLIREIQRDIADAVKCPSCGHEFSVADPNIDIVEKREVELPEAKELQDEVEIELKQATEEWDKINEQVKQIRLSIETLSRQERQLKTKRTDITNDIRELRADINTAQRDIDKHTSTIAEKKAAKFIDASEELKEKIKTCKTSQVKVDEELALKKEKKGKLLEIRARYSKFKTYLANKSIGAIQTFTNHFLIEMRSQLSVKIDGYKVTKTGAVREEIAIYISRDGLFNDKFGKFSEGQRERINIASILAMQKIINTSSKKGFNLLVIDEVMSSLDSTGIEKILNAMSNLNQTILVITHGTFNQTYPNRLKVQYQNRISTLVA